MSLSTFHKEASVVRQEQKSGFRDEEVRQEEEAPPYMADQEVDRKEDRSPGREGRAGPHEGGEFSRTLVVRERKVPNAVPVCQEARPSSLAFGPNTFQGSRGSRESGA